MSLESWVSVDIALSAFAPINLSDVFQFKVVGDGDVFFDNLYFWKTPVSATTSWNNDIDIIGMMLETGVMVLSAGTNVTIPSGLVIINNWCCGGCNDIYLVSDANGTATLVDDEHFNSKRNSYCTKVLSNWWNDLQQITSISSPVSNAQTLMYAGYYVQWYEEAMNQWHRYCFCFRSVDLFTGDSHFLLN
ncbi:MAG: hypothetical protein R2764_01935 [Bacteroidales bacterium]